MVKKLTYWLANKINFYKLEDHLIYGLIVLISISVIIVVYLYLAK